MKQDTHKMRKVEGVGLVRGRPTSPTLGAVVAPVAERYRQLVWGQRSLDSTCESTEYQVQRKCCNIGLLVVYRLPRLGETLRASCGAEQPHPRRWFVPAAGRSFIHADLPNSSRANLRVKYA